MTQVEQQTVTWHITSGNPWANTPQETAARLVRLSNGRLMFAVPVWEDIDEDCGWFWWQAGSDGDISYHFDEPLIDEDGKTLVVAVSDLVQFPTVPE